jgi:outer membrane protein assembly factor BamA
MKLTPVVLAVAIAGTLQAEPSSRVAEILAEREQKARRLTPDQPSKWERRLNWIKDTGVVDRFDEGYSGLRVKLGGLVTGSGFAAGPEFSREGLLDGRLNLRASAQNSTRGYRKQDANITLPRFLNDRITLDFYAVNHDYPSLQYYGPGPDSKRTGRSDYQHKDTAMDATVSVRILPRFHAGASIGYLLNEIGPGNDRRFVSAEQIYRGVPGVEVQSDFARWSAFAQYDSRDYAPGPRSGGNYFIQLHDFSDRSFGLYDFQRLDVEAQQYVPFFNKRRVIALRAKTSLTMNDGGQPLPFYMQPTLGGSDDLRGFRPFRFRDNNLLLMNAEYRWEVFSGLDMAVFADAGKVFAKRSQLDFADLETSAGFGFRFNARNNVFLRLDVGFSHEGFQVAFKFNNLFRGGPLRTSSSQGDF